MDYLKGIENFLDGKLGSQVWLNSRASQQQLQLAKSALIHERIEKNLLYLMSSGTTAKVDEFKLVGLSAEALQCSAQAVNEFFKVTPQDRWLNVLPLFHVGGIGMVVRAREQDAEILSLHEEKWDPNLFIKKIIDFKASMTSLVPTMIFDIVSSAIRAPDCLRVAVVGGGALEENLKQQARSLGWPLVTSYGLTEASSQVATEDETGQLRILSHIEAGIDDSAHLQIRSKALFTEIVDFKADQMRIYDPKIDGWYTTKDRVTILASHLSFLGRSDDLVKINGELVSLSKLNRYWQQALPDNRYVLIAEEDPRSGNRIILFVESGIAKNIQLMRAEVESALLPIERVKEIRIVERLPRSDLGKVLVGQLIKN